MARTIDGTPVRYLRFDGEQPDALPIVLTHGWPSTFLELAPARPAPRRAVGTRR